MSPQVISMLWTLLSRAILSLDPFSFSILDISILKQEAQCEVFSFYFLSFVVT